MPHTEFLLNSIPNSNSFLLHTKFLIALLLNFHHPLPCCSNHDFFDLFSSTYLLVPHFLSSNMGDRAFSATDPRLWTHYLLTSALFLIKLIFYIAFHLNKKKFLFFLLISPIRSKERASWEGLKPKRALYKLYIIYIYNSNIARLVNFPVFVLTEWSVFHTISSPPL